MTVNLYRDGMPKLIIIEGPNASGKSGLSVATAKHLEEKGITAEIISADSRQVFTGLDLGSGKITVDEMEGIKHHMLDVAAPNDFFSVKEFQTGAYNAIDDIIARGNVPILCGGTGLYVNAVADGYELNDAAPDPELRAEMAAKSLEELLCYINEKAPEALKTVATDNKRRVERLAEKVASGQYRENPSKPRYSCLEIGVLWPREVLYQRIEERLGRRLEQGMIEEVVRLREEGATDDFLYRLGLEYRYILQYLRGEFPSKEVFREELFKDIRHLAKEQMTWFRKRKAINWVEMDKPGVKELVADMCDEFLIM